MSSLAQEAVEKICQLFQDCSSALQLQVCLSTALAYLWLFERIGVLFLFTVLSVDSIAGELFHILFRAVFLLLSPSK